MDKQDDSSIMIEMLKLGEAARMFGCSPRTIRRWAQSGKIISHKTPGGQTVYSKKEILSLLGGTNKPERVEAHYCRVSSTTGQATSLVAQEALLKETSTAPIHKVFKDTGSGLNEKRAGLNFLLEEAKQGHFTVVRVTHEDRLARFGVSWLKELLNAYGVELEILNGQEHKSPEDELLQDFMSLIASFSGKFYGLRSRDNQKKLLNKVIKHSS